MKSPVRAAQDTCAALTGLNLYPIQVPPGFQSTLSRALSPRALLYRALYDLCWYSIPSREDTRNRSFLFASFSL